LFSYVFAVKFQRKTRLKAAVAAAKPSEAPAAAAAAAKPGEAAAAAAATAILCVLVNCCSCVLP
jgi:hypothetical protein